MFGETEVYLEGRRSEVRTQETNLGDLTADANLFVAQQYDSTVQVSLKNGGGIRAAIGEIDGLTGDLLPPPANPAAGKNVGEVSQLDIENTLRFNNTLTLVTLSAADLVEIIEHGVAETAPGETPGRFPQVSGMEFSFDPTLAVGERVLNLALVDSAGDVIDVVQKDGELVGDPEREIRAVSLDFLVGGGDDYPFPALAEDTLDLDSVGLPAGAATFTDAGTEQDAFAEYLVANFPVDTVDTADEKPAFSDAETAPELDERIQDVGVRSDSVLDGVIVGTEGRDIIVGTNNSDRIFALGGNDLILSRGGDDFIVTGSGRNFVRAGSGDDIVMGGPGNKVLLGDSGNDLIYGMDGNDRTYGGSGNDILLGGAGNDAMFGQAGNDILVGGGGIDRGYGGGGDDIIIGGVDSDLLFGQGGDDLLIGGSTVYDADVVALNAILSVWGGSGSVSNRVSSLRTSTSVPLNSSTVWDDGATDILFGGSSLDWFFLGTGDVSDKKFWEFMN